MLDDISIPLSAPIARELRRARDAARADKIDSPYVFPGASDEGHLVKVDIDGLPMYGMSLRRTYRTVAADLAIDDLHVHFLMGHALPGVSKGYVSKLIMAAGPALRVAQRRMSARIEGLLAGRR